MEIGNRDNLVQLARDIQAHRVILDRSAKEIEIQIQEDSRSVSQNRPHTAEQKVAMNKALDGTLMGASFQKLVETYHSVTPVD
jgi:hypothetical protein